MIMIHQILKYSPAISRDFWVGRMDSDETKIYANKCCVCDADVCNMPHQHHLTPVVQAALAALGVDAAGSFVCCRHFVVTHTQRVRKGDDVCLASAGNAWVPASLPAAAATSATSSSSSASSVFSFDETSASTKRRRSLAAESGRAADASTSPVVETLRAVLNGVVTATPESQRQALQLLNQSECGATRACGQSDSAPSSARAFL